AQSAAARAAAVSAHAPPAAEPELPGLELAGSAGPDQLVGGSGPDDLDGGDGNDQLDAGPGDDVLEGGARDARERGGPGSDVYVFGDASGSDEVIEDAEPGGFDGLLFVGVPLGALAFERHGDDLELRAAGGTRVRVRDFFLGERIEWLAAEDG